MPGRARLVLVAALSVIYLLASVAGASARNFEIVNSERGFRIVWVPIVLEVVGLAITCHATLEGTFTRRTFAKVAGTTVGRITAARVGECREGEIIFLQEVLPWEIQYAGFTGTLPNITGLNLNIIRLAWRIIINRGQCLASTERGRPLRVIANVTAGGIVSVTINRNALIETEGGFFCDFGSPARFERTGEATVMGGTEETTIRLI